MSGWSVGVPMYSVGQRVRVESDLYGKGQVGQITYVERVDSDGDVWVKIGRHSWCFPPDLEFLEPVSEQDR